jgi:phage gpG-like protein
MGAAVEIQVIDRASPLLMMAMAKIKDFRKPLTLCGMYEKRSFAMQFEVDGKPPWKPLSPVTIARRRNKSSKPLQDTGRLKRSYVSRGGDSIWQLTPNFLRIGSNVNYAGIHQFGAILTRTVQAGRQLMRRTRSGQYRFMRSGSRQKAALGAFWSGGKNYSINIPARPLRVQPEDVPEMRKIFIQHALGAFKK